MIVLYLGNLLIGQIKNIEELNDFLKEEIERINELRNKGYYVRFPKWAKLKKDYRPLIYGILIVLIISILIYLIVSLFNKEPVHNEVLKGYKEAIYEFTY